MKILLTGATGYIGSSVLDVLRAHGHDVVAPVRSAHAAQKATATGATAVVGDITDADWSTPLLEGVDAAIHTAAPSDGTAPQFDAAVAEAVIAAFSGTGKPYIHTGGLWIHGPSDDLTEQTPFNPPAIVAWREGVESRSPPPISRSRSSNPGSSTVTVPASPPCWAPLRATPRVASPSSATAPRTGRPCTSTTSPSCTCG